MLQRKLAVAGRVLVFMALLAGCAVFWVVTVKLVTKRVCQAVLWSR